MEQVQIAAGAFLLRKVYREMFGWDRPASYDSPSFSTRPTVSLATSPSPRS